MKIFSWNSPDSIEKMVALLNKGGVLVGSSDTVLGLLATPTIEGKEKLDQIKGRQDKPYLVLASSYETVKTLVDPAHLLQAENLLKACWPGPLTIIVNVAKKSPKVIASAKGGVAIRVPKHEGLQTLLQKVGILFSTSANLAGQAVPQIIEDVHPDILARVDGVVMDGTTRTSTLSVPSTILDLTGERPVLVREGAYSKKYLEELLGENF